MEKRIIIIAFAAAAFISLIALEMACAYWIWTPETKKFVNPKYAVKDSPKEQFEWAMSFYQAKDYQKAAQEFEKLTKQYEYSEYASKAQYYVGLCYENMNKLYFAFQNYQKAIDNFPHIENMEEIIAREFNIANIYEEKASPKVLGTDIMTSTDRAVEIYKKVVDNAPFGRLADESQFRMGQAFKKAERYDEAIPAFQKILDDYPNSQFIDKVKFEVADCAYKASLKPAYDIESTDKAIKAFEDFGQTNRDEKLSGEAGKTIQRLKDKAAEKLFITAQFYESQRHYESAIIYYKDVVARFPDSSIAVKAKAKIEELGNRGRKNAQSVTGKEGEKKSWMPFSIPKKPKTPKPQAASKDVKSQKKSWQFFKFAKPAKKEKPEAAPVPKPEKPKSWWNPLKFASKPKQEKAVRPPAPISAKDKKSWTPLSFTKKPKPSGPVAIKKEAESQAAETEAPVQAEVTPPKTETAGAKPAEEETVTAQEAATTQGTVATQETAVSATETKTEFAKAEISAEDIVAPSESAVVKEETKTTKKVWIPLSFNRSEKKEKPEAAPVPKPEKPKSWWNPLKFASKPKQEKAVRPADSAAKEKKAWAPLSFTKKPKPSGPATAKEGTNAPKKSWWSPLKFASKPKQEKAVRPPAPISAKDKKSWTPLSFTKKPKPSEPAAVKEEAAEAKPAEGETKAVAVQETVIIQDDVVTRRAPTAQGTAADVAAPADKQDQ